MPTKMFQASCCKDRAVLISFYVEKPRRRKLSSSNPSHRPHHHCYHHHHHHNHHHYLHLHHPDEEARVQSRGTYSGVGYNRRAELLHYSQHLRESARPATQSTSLLPAPISTNDHQISDKAITVQRKRKTEMAPACLGNYKIMMTRFLRSFIRLQAKKDGKKRKRNTKGSARHKMKEAMKSQEAPKKWAFWSKMLSALRKQR